MAAVELYEAIEDKDDLLDSLNTVIEKVKLKRGRRPRLFGLQPTKRNEPAPQRQQEEEKKERPAPRKFSDLDDTPKSIQDDEKKRFKQHQH